MIKTMNIKNMKQADFFIKNGLIPIGAQVVNKVTVITFLRNTECDRIFTKWIKQKQKYNNRII